VSPDLAAFLVLSVLYITKSPLVNSVVVKVATVALFLRLATMSLTKEEEQGTPDAPVPEDTPEDDLYVHDSQYPDKDPDKWLQSIDAGRTATVRPAPPSATHTFWGSIAGASMAPYRAPTTNRSYSSHVHNPNHEYEW
jgi:hypothetical protein